MDKLQKFLKGVWRYKERLVLVVLLGFLAVRVYGLFVPQPLDLGGAGNPRPSEVPQIPPNNPAPDAPGQLGSLHRTNPFTYHSDAPTEEGQLTGREAGIELLDMKQMPGGEWKVRLKTGIRKWYSEGEEFEEFKLEKINPEEKTAVVYAERFAKTVTLRLP